MKKFLLAICLSMAVCMVVTPAYALELWDYHLRGVDEGLAAGALPPAGLYFINDSYFASFVVHGGFDPVKKAYDASQAQSGAKLPGYVDVPILVWVPGCKFLNADYAMAIAEPFDFTALRLNSGTAIAAGPFKGLTAWATGDQWGAFNTVLIPIALSWKCGDWRIKGAFQFGLNDGTSSPNDSMRALAPHTGGSLVGKDGQVYAWSSNDNWAFTPNLGISYLHAGWNFSADFFYTVYTKDSDTQYQNGDEFAADYTITYTCGKWTFGVGASQENQIENDKFVGAVPPSKAVFYQSQPNTKAEQYTMGPIIGYNFGPISLLATYNWELETKNNVGGNFFLLRMIIPLGNPCFFGR
ncbi:MAG TPA: transporter [Syntrophobacteraceae bacterium]|nr:transporter [Syntrophobacteraceae bacterium]